MAAEADEKGLCVSSSPVTMLQVASQLLAPYARSVRAAGKVSLWSFVKTLRHKEVYEL